MVINRLFLSHKELLIKKQGEAQPALRGTVSPFKKKISLGGLKHKFTARTRPQTLGLGPCEGNIKLQDLRKTLLGGALPGFFIAGALVNYLGVHDIAFGFCALFGSGRAFSLSGGAGLFIHLLGEFM